jgi:hypothetical protein
MPTGAELFVDAIQSLGIARILRWSAITSTKVWK